MDTEGPQPEIGFKNLTVKLHPWRFKTAPVFSLYSRISHVTSPLWTPLNPIFARSNDKRAKLNLQGCKRKNHWKMLLKKELRKSKRTSHLQSVQRHRLTDPREEKMCSSTPVFTRFDLCRSNWGILHYYYYCYSGVRKAHVSMLLWSVAVNLYHYIWFLSRTLFGFITILLRFCCLCAYVTHPFPCLVGWLWKH